MHPVHQLWTRLCYFWVVYATLSRLCYFESSMLLRVFESQWSWGRLSHKGFAERCSQQSIWGRFIWQHTLQHVLNEIKLQNVFWHPSHTLTPSRCTGVKFIGSLRDGYRAVLWLRCGIRVLMLVESFAQFRRVCVCVFVCVCVLVSACMLANMSDARADRRCCLSFLTELVYGQMCLWIRVLLMLVES